MILTNLTYTLYIVLGIYAALISYAVWRGENGIDRLIGVDLIGALMLSVFVLIALIEENSIFIDAALGLAAFGFIGVVAFARYVANKRLF